jgi:ATP-dependent DNA helicase RecQ
VVDIDDPRPDRPPRRTPSAGNGAEPLTPEVAVRFEALKAWRLEEARAREVPAYVVFNDRTLAELATRLPADERSLLDVPGVGPAKIAIYGQALLRMLAEMRAREELPA